MVVQKYRGVRNGNCDQGDVGDGWPRGRQRPTHKTCKYERLPSRSTSISIPLGTQRVWRHNVNIRMCVYLTDTNCVDTDTSTGPVRDQCTQLFV